MSGSKVNEIDVLIVGAGPIGLAAALWFCKKAYKVFLIEQYAEIKNAQKLAFNERHQQVGLNDKTLNFLKELDIVVWGEVKRRGCADEAYINIPIYVIQNIFMKELRNYANLTILFETKIEAVTCIDADTNCRILMTQNLTDNVIVYGVYSKLVVIADGKHDDRGVAKTFFGFSAASKVHTSTYGILGMITRQLSDDGRSSICLKNYSTNHYISQLRSDLGFMHLRLLGNMNERYIALGLVNIEDTDKFLALTSNEIKLLLLEAYNTYRDRNMGETEIEDFNYVSKSPIQIVLDYRKETIKLLEGSSTIVTIEGDAARKTTFFSGSGLNSGYEGLAKLFAFWTDKEESNTSSTLSLDQKLLEKDQDCMKITYQLLSRGIDYIGNKSAPNTFPLSESVNLEPIIESINPSSGEAPWFIHITGQNLIGPGALPPKCIFEWAGNSICMSSKVIVYDSNRIGVKIPSRAEGKVSMILERSDGKIFASPIKYEVVKLTDKPEISDINWQDEWLCIEGKNFTIPTFVTVKNCNGENKIKAYCNSINSLILSVPAFIGPVLVYVHTSQGTSLPFTKDFTP